MDHLDPLLPAGVIARRHLGGVSLDFPAEPDRHMEARRQAWRFGEAGALFLVASLVSFAFSHVVDPLSVLSAGVAGVLFLTGIVFLLMATSRSSWAWKQNPGVDSVGQLAVADNLLIRTQRDEQKQVWYREEIRAIHVGVMDLNDPAVQIYVELENGETVALLSKRVSDFSVQAVEQVSAELQAIARFLFQALWLESNGMPVIQSSAAIKDLAKHEPETRIVGDAG